VDDRKCGTIASKPVESKGCGEVVAAVVPTSDSGSGLSGKEQVTVQEQSKPAIMQKPEQSFFEAYKLWMVGGLFLLMLIITVVFTVHHHILGGNRGGEGGVEQGGSAGEGK